MSGRRLAAVVTVQQYSDGTIASLEGSFKDGSELCHVLRNSGFLAEHIHQQDDDDVVDALEEMVAGLGSGDLFLFYFAGHGFTPEGTNEHLLLGPDAKLSRIERGHARNVIKLSYLDDIFTRPGLDRMFVLDACRTHVRKGRGGSASLRTVAHLRDIGNRRQKAAGSYAVLNSCSKGEQACELPKRKQGLFTAALTDVLQDSHKTGKGLRADTALKDVLSSRMRDLALEEGLSGSQHPAFRAGGPGTIVLIDGESGSSRVAEASTTSRLRVLSSTLYIDSDPEHGAEVRVDEERVGATPCSVRLKSGTYSITASLDGYESWNGEIDFRAGGGTKRLTCSLEKLPEEDVVVEDEDILTVPDMVPPIPTMFGDSDSSRTSYMGGRFLKDPSTGVIEDRVTGLDWLVGPDESTSHFDAQNWVDGLGRSWRLPSADELKELYESGITTKDWGPFENSGYVVWTGELIPEDSSRARYVFFSGGGHLDWYGRDGCNSNRVFAVRSRG